MRHWRHSVDMPWPFKCTSRPLYGPRSTLHKAVKKRIAAALCVCQLQWLWSGVLEVLAQGLHATPSTCPTLCELWRLSWLTLNALINCKASLDWIHFFFPARYWHSWELISKSALGLFFISSDIKFNQWLKSAAPRSTVMWLVFYVLDVFLYPKLPY